MKRTLRTKIWCAVLVVACVSGVAFGVANLPRVQAEAVSGGVEVTEAPGNEAVVSEESKAEVPEISGNPEISQLEISKFRNQNIGRLDVSMYNSFFLACLQGTADIKSQLEHFFHRHYMALPVHIQICEQFHADKQDPSYGIFFLNYLVIFNGYNIRGRLQ